VTTASEKSEDETVAMSSIFMAGYAPTDGTVVGLSLALHAVQVGPLVDGIPHIQAGSGPRTVQPELTSVARTEDAVTVGVAGRP
ncbi:Hypothetical protein KLENKIAIHU_822, partial [Klenkia terrae]|jgi:hypothetical protein